MYTQIQNVIKETYYKNVDVTCDLLSISDKMAKTQKTCFMYVSWEIEPKFLNGNYMNKKE